MKARSTRLALEALEDRNVPSTVAYADFNQDDLLDMAAVTSPTTITVGLASPDGNYSVSAILTAPKNLPVTGLSVDDYNHDGKLDIISGGLANNRFYTHIWVGNGDGTFGDLDTQMSAHIPKKWFF